MTDRDIKELIFRHKPHLRFQRVGKYADHVADDEIISVVIIKTLYLDTWFLLPAWDTREPRPPWATELIPVVREYLRTHRPQFSNADGDDVVICFASQQ